MEYVRRAFADSRKAALTVGLGTIVVSHVSLFWELAPESWSAFEKKNHATVNLGASALILYGSGILG